VPVHVPAAAVGGIISLTSIIVGLLTGEALTAAATIGIAGIVSLTVADGASHIGGGGHCINGIAAGCCCVPVAAAAPD
jgi:hypothetical protein